MLRKDRTANATIGIAVRVSVNSTSAVNVTLVEETQRPIFIVQPNETREQNITIISTVIPSGDLSNWVFFIIELTNLTGEAWVTYRIFVIDEGIYGQPTIWERLLWLFGLINITFLGGGAFLMFGSVWLTKKILKRVCTKKEAS